MPRTMTQVHHAGGHRGKPREKCSLCQLEEKGIHQDRYGRITHPDGRPKKANEITAEEAAVRRPVSARAPDLTPEQRAERARRIERRRTYHPLRRRR